MFCPRCGHERVSTDTSFCSGCGFLLSGTLELMMTGGINPTVPAERPDRGPSPRRRGMMKGLFIFLLTFLIVPIIAIITVALRAEPYMVVISSIILAVGGLLRMAYAWMFESPDPSPGPLTATPAFPPSVPFGDLPAGKESFVPPYFAPQREKNTNDLQPASVTEGTTRLLENEPFDQ